LESGADFVKPFTEPRSPRGLTPVEVALVNGHRELAEQLLALGARPPRLEPEDAFVAALLIPTRQTKRPQRSSLRCGTLEPGS
jgi:ankyrin repeat protein